jgi:hypothetical protein
MNYAVMKPTVCDADVSEISFFLGGAYSQDSPVPCEAMPGLEVLTAPNLQLTSSSVRFITPDRRHIEVVW